MKIAYVLPGTGGTFYCQNCVRDIALVGALRAAGHDVVAVPMYLPPRIGSSEVTTSAPVFYGAVNLYLGHTLPFFKRLPRFMTRFLDRRGILDWAARKSGTTRAASLESLTISMLKGADGGQARELDRMIGWLKAEGGFDIVHLSNALLLGMTARLKTDVGIPIVCSLQDEEQWIDSMDRPYREHVWQLIRTLTAGVDGFIAVSRYYAELMTAKLGLPAAKVYTVPLGIDARAYPLSSLPMDPPVIGYMARIARSMGLDILIDAFAILKKEEAFRNVRLHINGGQTGDDLPFIREIKRTAVDRGLAESIDFFEHFGDTERREFIRGLTVMCVPVPAGEAFGLFLIEAMAAGVPAVQPEAGGYPEVIAATEGGLTYSPNDAVTLAQTLAGLLGDPGRLRSLGAKGKENVCRSFTLEQMVEGIAGVYAKICGTWTDIP